MGEVPFYRPSAGQEEIEAAARVLRSDWWTQGTEVEAFEAEAAEVLGVPEGHEVVAVSNCTAGLYLLLQAHNVGPEWTVAVPDLTFAATINAVLAVGAKAEILDVDDNGILEALGLGKWLIERSRSAKVAAIAVSFAGIHFNPPFEPRGLVIHDQAHSFQPGAYRPNSSWSFFPTKNITGGEGGLVGCDSSVAKEIRARRNHGRSETYRVDYRGCLNHRMTDIQAAVLRVQLKKLPQMLLKKRAIEGIYRRRLAGYVMLPPKGVTHLFWIQSLKRDRIREALAKRGIGTSIHYKPLSRLGYGGDKRACVKAGLIADMTLSLPFWPDLTEVEIIKICDIVEEAATCEC